MSAAEQIGRLVRAQPYGVLCTQAESQPYGSLVAGAGHYGLTAAELDFIPSADSGQVLNYDTRLRQRYGAASQIPPRPRRRGRRGLIGLFSALRFR